MPGVAENHLIDLRRIDAAALDCRLRDRDAELRCGHRCQRAAEFPDRRAQRCDQEDVFVESRHNRATVSQ